MTRNVIACPTVRPLQSAPPRELAVVIIGSPCLPSPCPIPLTLFQPFLLPSLFLQSCACAFTKRLSVSLTSTSSIAADRAGPARVKSWLPSHVSRQMRIESGCWSRFSANHKAEAPSKLPTCKMYMYVHTVFCHDMYRVAHVAGAQLFQHPLVEVAMMFGVSVRLTRGHSVEGMLSHKYRIIGQLPRMVGKVDLWCIAQLAQWQQLSRVGVCIRPR